MKSSAACRLLLLTLILITFSHVAMRSLLMPRADEALLLHQGKLIAEGSVPYRDFFQFVFPGSLYLVALVFKLLGPSLVAIRLLTTGCYLVSMALLYALGRRYLYSWGVFLLMVFLTERLVFNYHDFSHHAWSGGLSFWAVASVMFFLRTGNIRLLMLAGVCSALAILFTQSTGLLITGALAFFIAGRAWIFSAVFSGKVFGEGAVEASAERSECFKALACFLAPVFSVAAVTLGVLIAQGNLSDFWQDTIDWVLTGAYAKTTLFGYFSTGADQILNTAFRLVPPDRLMLRWETLPQAMAVLFAGWLPVLGILWAAQYLWQKKRLEKISEKQAEVVQEIFLLFLSASVLLIGTLSYSTPYHILANGWPAFLLSAMAVRYLCKTYVSAGVAKTLIGLALLGLFYTMGFRTWNLGTIFSTPACWIDSYGTTEQKVFVWEGPSRALSIATGVELIRKYTGPTEPIFVFNWSSEFYLLANRAPATRYEIIYPLYTTMAQRQELMAALAANPPRVIVYDQKDRTLVNADERFYRHADTLPALTELHTWIARHYEAVWTTGGLTVLIRSPRGTGKEGIEGATGR